jgi:hypothetical protein
MVMPRSRAVALACATQNRRAMKAILVAFLLLVGGCKKESKAKAPPGTVEVAAVFGAVQKGDYVEVTISTEPNVEVYMAPDRGGVTPRTQNSDAQGKATARIEGALGANSLLVVATAPDKRRGEHAVPFSIEKFVPITFTDPTPRTGELDFVGCDSTLLDANQRVTDLCPGDSVNFAPDFSVGIAVASSAVTKIVIDEQTFASQNGAITARVNLMPKILALDTLLALSVEHPIKYNARIEVNGTTSEGVLEFGRDALVALLAKVTEGPLAFEGSRPAPAKPASVIVIGDLTEAFASDDGVIRDLDLVGIATSTRRKAPACDYVSTENKEKTKTLERVMSDYAVTIYDRRTGRKVGSKSWSAPTPECQQWIKWDAKNPYSEPDLQLINDWVRSFVKR